MPTKIWSNISMDFIDSLPKSQGKTVIFVVVDMLSKYDHFIPLSHPYIATDVAQVFLDNIYKLHGLPNTIASDRDKVLLSTFWKELFKLMQVYVWGTAKTFDGVGLSELSGGSPYVVGGDSRVELVDRSLTAREKAIEVCKFHLKRAHDRMKFKADKHMTDREYVVGNWVY
ncbi:retrotransposable element Tf2 [Tanacetum coccineum]